MCMILALLTSCSDDDNGDSTEASILGEWKHYSTTLADDNETFFAADGCPSELSITDTDVTIKDYIDVTPPCERYDISFLRYEIAGNVITTTSDGITESFTIVTLNATTLRLRNDDGVVEYRR